MSSRTLGQGSVVCIGRCVRGRKQKTRRNEQSRAVGFHRPGPIGSSVDTNDKLNCYTEGAFDPTGTLPYNCDHAQIPGIKGHDHLVGVPGSQKAGGDFNVAWHVMATFFTPQGVSDGAMNTRILTLQQLTDAQKAKDVTGFVDTGIYFNCSVVSSPVYMNGTALSFPPFPSP